MFGLRKKTPKIDLTKIIFTIPEEEWKNHNIKELKNYVKNPEKLFEDLEETSNIFCKIKGSIGELIFPYSERFSNDMFMTEKIPDSYKGFIRLGEQRVYFQESFSAKKYVTTHRSLSNLILKAGKTTPITMTGSMTKSDQEGFPYFFEVFILELEKYRSPQILKK